MKFIIRCAIFPMLSLFLCDCHVESVKQDPMKAVSETNQFMKALYFEEHSDEALRLADPTLSNSVKPDDLENMVERIKREAGALKKLKADSYLMTPGRSMELFYVGTYERGLLYHRLVLVGDASSGYKVSGVWFQPEPYPEQPLRRKFNSDIFIQREPTASPASTP